MVIPFRKEKKSHIIAFILMLVWVILEEYLKEKNIYTLKDDFLLTNFRYTLKRQHLNKIITYPRIGYCLF